MGKRVDIYSVLYSSSNTVQYIVYIHVTLLALVQTASSRDDPLSYLTRFLLLFFFFVLLCIGDLFVVYMADYPTSIYIYQKNK